MSTIALYANQMNRMPGMFAEVKQKVTDYKAELDALKSKTLSINKSVCNLDDVVRSVQSSTSLQEQKGTSLDTFTRDSENFIADTVHIDGNVADIVNQRKNDFYDRYGYLKPECEKSWLEKAGEWLTSAKEWCAEHWATVVTVMVVIVVAAVAAVCGVAIAFIAGVAGIVALVICAADLICMLSTGGKTIADVLRENGMHVLADIFDGVSIGADLVSIAFPVGAALKTMVKVGAGTFAKISFAAAQTAFKETIEKVFKSGFKNGVKNLGQIAFKTFLVDFDDFKVFRPKSRIPKPNKYWIKDGDRLLPNAGSVPARSNNPDGLTMEGIMQKFGYDSIPLLKDGSPDMRKIALFEADISMKNLKIDLNSNNLSSKLRTKNFANANLKLKQAFDANLVEYATKDEFAKALGYQLTWHEDRSMNKCWLVPRELHANLQHIGGISEYQFHINGIADKISRITEKLGQKEFRLKTDKTVDAAF